MNARRVLTFSLVLYAVAGVAGMFLGDLGSILGSRALVGVAAAGAMTSSTTIAATALQGDERVRFFARQASVMSLAGVLSVALGGLLASFHWRAPFILYVVAAPLALVAASLPRPTPRSSTERGLRRRADEWYARAD